MNKNVLVLILLSLIYETYGQTVLDMMLVVDSSRSMGEYNFVLAKKSVVEIINQLNTIGPQKNRVGVINYSSTVQTITSLVNTDQDKARIIANVNNMPYLMELTATGDALARARQIFFDYPREGIPRILVLITDGYSNTGANVFAEAYLLKYLDLVTIYTVGVGSGINEDELNAISSKPLSTYKKLIASYKDLYAAINEITRIACETPVFIRPEQKVLV
jgi:hypothetical protein